MNTTRRETISAHSKRTTFVPERHIIWAAVIAVGLWWAIYGLVEVVDWATTNEPDFFARNYKAPRP